MPNLTLPGYRYLGPGNPLDAGTPVNKTDDIARTHDYAYHNAQTKQDIYDSDWTAIKAFSAESIKNPTLWGPKLGALGLGVKTLAERASGTVYYGLAKRKAEEGGGPDSKMATQDPTVSSTSMDTSGVDPAAAAVGGAPPGSSMGGGSATQFMYAGSHQTRNTHTRHYKKIYRFFTECDLPSYTLPTASNSSDDDDNFIQYKPGSMFEIPVQYAWLYLSENEFAEMASFVKTKVKKVRAKISSQGIRLPFATQEATSVTANATAQVPFFKMSQDFCKYYLIKNDGQQIEDTRIKCIGGFPSDWATTNKGTFSTTFQNLSARATVRKFKLDPIIKIPSPLIRSTNSTAPVRYRYPWGDPDIHAFKEVVLNGTSVMGPVFDYEYTPKNNVLTNRSFYLPQQYWGTNNLNGGATRLHTDKINYQKGQGPVNNIELPPDVMPAFEKEGQFIMPSLTQTYNSAVIENANVTRMGGSPSTFRQDRFIMGIDFLRNADGTLLNAVWEWVLEVDLEAECTTGNEPGVYGLGTRTATENLYPDYTHGTFGNRGLAEPQAWDNGNKFITNQRNMTMMWNVPETTTTQRVIADITPTDNFEPRVTRSMTKNIIE